MPHHKLLLRFLSWYYGGGPPTEPTGAIAAIGRELAAIGRELEAIGREIAAIGREEKRLYSS